MDKIKTSNWKVSKPRNTWLWSIPYCKNKTSPLSTVPSSTHPSVDPADPVCWRFDISITGHHIGTQQQHRRKSSWRQMEGMDGTTRYICHPRQGCGIYSIICGEYVNQYHGYNIIVSLFLIPLPILNSIFFSSFVSDLTTYIYHLMFFANCKWFNIFCSKYRPHL